MFSFRLERSGKRRFALNFEYIFRDCLSLLSEGNGFFKKTPRHCTKPSYISAEGRLCGMHKSAVDEMMFSRRERFNRIVIYFEVRRRTTKTYFSSQCIKYL